MKRGRLAAGSPGASSAASRAPSAVRHCPLVATGLNAAPRAGRSGWLSLNKLDKDVRLKNKTEHSLKVAVFLRIYISGSQKCGPWTINVSIIWELFRTANALGSDLLKQKNSRLGHKSLCFNSALRDSDACQFNFENHCTTQ